MAEDENRLVTDLWSPLCPPVILSHPRRRDDRVVKPRNMRSQGRKLREHRLSNESTSILVRYGLAGSALLLLMAVQDRIACTHLTAFFTHQVELNAIDTLYCEVRAIFAFPCLDDPGYWDGGVLPDEFEGGSFIIDTLRGPFFTSIDPVNIIEWPHGDGLSEGSPGEGPCGLWLPARRHIALGLGFCCIGSRLAEVLNLEEDREKENKGACSQSGILDEAIFTRVT